MYSPVKNQLFLDHMALQTLTLSPQYERKQAIQQNDSIRALPLMDTLEDTVRKSIQALPTPAPRPTRKKPAPAKTNESSKLFKPRTPKKTLSKEERLHDALQRVPSKELLKRNQVRRKQPEIESPDLEESPIPRVPKVRLKSPEKALRFHRSLKTQPILRWD